MGDLWPHEAMSRAVRRRRLNQPGAANFVLAFSEADGRARAIRDEAACSELMIRRMSAAAAEGW
jgi:hypothetical protein